MSFDAGPKHARPVPDDAGPFELWIGRVARWLAIVAGLVLTAVAVTVSISILGRWLFGREITGAFEIVQVGVAAAGFLFLPICQFSNQNIIVDAFTTQTPTRFRAGLDAFWSFAYAAVALVLTWRLAIGAAETFRSGMTTAMLQLPYAWAMVVGTAALAFLGLVSLIVAVRHLRNAR